MNDPFDGPLARARAFGPVIEAAADEIERRRRLVPEALDALHAGRLARMFVPCSAGGDEIAPAEALAAIEYIAGRDLSAGWNVFVANAAALIAPYLPAESARAIFGDPRALVAWGPPGDAPIAAVPGGYRVNGRWGFASGCRHATWMGAHGRVVEADGEFRRGANGAPLVLTALFPAREAELLDDWNAIGMRGTGSESYRVRDLFVPEEFCGLREDPHARREPGTLYAFTMQSLYAAGAAAVALGAARAMLDALTALAARKAPRGLARLADRPMTQAAIARAEAGLSAARAWLFAVTSAIYEGARGAGEREPISVPDRARLRLAASHAIHAAVDAAQRVWREAGVDAIVPGGAFERRFRDIHTLSQQIQAREAHYERVGRVLLGDAPPDFL